MIVASIDPGESTGMIIYDKFEHEVLTVDSLPILDAYEYLLGLSPEQVILENFPDNYSVDGDVYFYFKQINRAFPCALINPGTWKPLAKARKWKSAGDQHIQDAYNLLRYWMFTIAREDIGDGVFGLV